MLVLSRKVGERLNIGDDIVLVISKIAGNRVTLAIEAPADVRVVRGELPPKPRVTESPGELMTVSLSNKGKAAIVG
ncbi:MAG: carbon storage regulator [Planctomycetaceae bacterium]|nr:MAG: carbon storage regulator [Planctomycetaceae bacterium]